LYSYIPKLRNLLEMFLYQKLIDRSTLRQGFQIPVEFHHLLKAIYGGMPQHGEARNIKIVINGVGYDAQLKNQGFDRNKYDGHAEVIRPNFMDYSLTPAISEGFVSMKYPANPHHPRQRYLLTVKGMMLLDGNNS